MVWSGTLLWMTNSSAFITIIDVFLGLNMACMSPTETRVAWLKVLKLFGPKIFFKVYMEPFSMLGLLVFTFSFILLSKMNVAATKESASIQPNIVRIYFSRTSEPNSTIKLESSFIVIQNFLLKLLHHFWSPQFILPHTNLYYIKPLLYLVLFTFLLFYSHCCCCCFTFF